MAKATTFRQEEKATNTETVADSKAAQTAVAQALAVLKDFYAKAADATALLRSLLPRSSTLSIRACSPRTVALSA